MAGEFESEFLGNVSGNETVASNCYGDYCVESTLYRKIMGTIVFVMVWPFIVLDMKCFPLGRPATALLGAVLMVLFFVVPQEQVYIVLGEQGNLQTLFLLIGMMLLSYYYDREGILKYIALWIFGKNKLFKHVLWKVCVLSAVLSAIITNDAACVVLTPLFLTEHIRQKRPKSEYPPLLLGIATSANIGSASTFFGNPQNAFIAANSNGEVSLLIFFVTTLPAAVLGMAISIALLYLCYFRTTWPKKHDEGETPPGIVGDLPIEVNEEAAVCCDELALSSVNPLSGKCEEDKNPTALKVSDTCNQASIMNGGKLSMECEATLECCAEEEKGTGRQTDSIATRSPSNSCTTATGWRKKAFVRWFEGLRNSAAADSRSPATGWRKKVFIGWLFFITCVVIILLAIPPPPTVPVEFNLGLVPVGAGVMTMLVDTLINRKYALDAIMKVDWTMILLFMGLFIWLTGFENTLFPNTAFNFIIQYMDLHTVQGVLLFTVFVAFGSNILSNVPLVILIVDQLFRFECGQNDIDCSGQLVGTLLAWVSTIAGNFTLIGSVENLIVAEKGRNIANYRLSFWQYFKFGFCSTTLVLFAGLPIVYFAGANVNI